jgi:hypothetical protein
LRASVSFGQEDWVHERRGSLVWRERGSAASDRRPSKVGRITLTGMLTAALAVASVAPRAADAAPARVTSAPAACGQWTVVPSPNRGRLGSSLTGVSATSATDAWAVGTSYTGSIYQTLAERWDGGAWSIVKTPNIGTLTNALTTTAAISETDAWAVGFYADGSTFRTLAMHWNGSKWAVVATPNVGTGENQLMSISALATNDVWAVGLAQSTPGAKRLTLVEHWDGFNWSVVPSPNVGTDENFLWSVSARAANDVWAVGSYSVPWFQTLVEHWDGHNWTVVTSPDKGDGNNVLYAVVALKATRVYAVGTWLNGNQTAALSVRYASAWKDVVIPSPAGQINWLSGLAASSTTDMWSVGWRVEAPFGTSTTLAEHWDGSNWTVEATPNVGIGENQLTATAVVPGTTTYWAIGHSFKNGHDQTLVETRC